MWRPGHWIVIAIIFHNNENVYLCWYIESGQNCRYFQTVCSQRSNWQYSIIGLGNSSSPDRRQTFTNDNHVTGASPDLVGCWSSPSLTGISWWRHQMEAFSALLAICAGNSPVPGEFPAQRPVTRSFDVFFDLRLNKRLCKQSWGWWFETLLCPLWRHNNVLVNVLPKSLRFRSLLLLHI